MEKNLWRWFPHGLFAAMALVFAVNGYMVYTAVSSFPGVAGTDGFDLSNGYKRVLDANAEQTALGWQIQAELDEARHLILRLTDRSGAALDQVTVEGHAERPVGPIDATPLTFSAAGNGRFECDKTLFSGQWDVMMTVHKDAQTYSTTRRVVVR